MKNLDLFPIIFKDTYDFNWHQIKPKVMSLIDESDYSATLEIGGKTTVGLNYYPDKRPHNWKEFSNFVEWIEPRVETVWQKWGLMPQKKYISESWFNLHNIGDYTKEHYHHSVHIVVASYLTCPPLSGCIQFKTPYEQQKLSEPVSCPDEGIWVDCEVNTNDVLVFPGWMKHRTTISNSNESRIVYTMNIIGVCE